MGRKYIIEIGRLERLYKAFIGAHGKPEITWLSPEVDLTPYTEPDMEQVKRDYDAFYEHGYEQGLSDAWEAARKIANIPYGEEEKVFGSGGWTFIINHTASEAIEKIRQYEQEKEMDGLRQNIQTIVDQCGYSLDEIAEVLAKMKES